MIVILPPAGATNWFGYYAERKNVGRSRIVVERAPAGGGGTYLVKAQIRRGVKAYP
jgi:hypothetical protein